MDPNTNPVSRRTRSKVNPKLSDHDYLQRMAASIKHVNVVKSEPENVEFLLVDRKGSVRKFYMDEMEMKTHLDLVGGGILNDLASSVQARVSLSSNVQGTNSAHPINIISDDDDDDDEEQVNGGDVKSKNPSANKIKGSGYASSKGMPLKKRHKAENPLGRRNIKKEMKMEASHK